MTEKRVALVTGASRGIGKAIAVALAKAGYCVAGTATSQGGVAAIEAYMSSEGLEGIAIKLNVTDSLSVKACIDTVVERLGHVEILVNNAGIVRDNLAMRMKPDEWHDVIQTNLTGVFNVTQACLRGMMKAKWGRIITIGSVVGSMGNPGSGNYVAAKAAVVGYSKSLALELSSRNITANVVAPGFIETDMTKSLTEEQRDAIFKQVPMGRIGQPDEVAHAVLYLASDESGYVTGQTLHVNGGLYLA